ncbi:MAG: LysM peptidoglycan-binding domain-containing protein [Alphaproteobacteria bacterium]|nr:LysM peptidoglycan-binding domain-containing protein [Alphaproteobacteria bacterium]
MLRIKPTTIALLMLLGLAACETPRSASYTSSVNIKPGRLVTVLSGETLYSFARRNNSSMREIIDLNRLQAPYQLEAGTTLTLPASDADLPSVELGPIAYENENAYKQKHKAHPVTTYTQVVPQPISEEKAQELKDNSVYSPRRLLQRSELQAQANEQFTQPIIQEKPVQPKAAPPTDLNLQPLHFDKKSKHLTEASKPATPVNVVVPEKTIPASRTLKNSKEKFDPNADALAQKAENVPPQLKSVEEKKPEPQAKKETAAKEPAMHSRIEKANDPVNFTWPVQGTVLSTFGPKSNGLKNDGINIGVPRGTPVVASDGGTVAYAGSDIPGYGNVVLVRHPSGLMTTYAHLDRMFVQQDIIVAKGDLLGTVGTSGGVDTPQLHFEIRRDKEALDPSKYLYR